MILQCESCLVSPLLRRADPTPMPRGEPGRDSWRLGVIAVLNKTHSLTHPGLADGSQSGSGIEDVLYRWLRFTAAEGSHQNAHPIRLLLRLLQLLTTQPGTHLSAMQIDTQRVRKMSQLTSLIVRSNI